MKKEKEIKKEIAKIKGLKFGKAKWGNLVEVCSCGKRATKPHKKRCLAWIMNGMSYGTTIIKLDLKI